MKGKSLIALAIASLISANLFALEITKGHLIKHKEWVTGNAKVTFKQGKHALDRNSHQKHFDGHEVAYNFVSSGLEAQTGVVGSATKIDSEHFFHIFNQTNAVQKYFYNFTVCADTYMNGTQEHEQCAHYYDEIELQPGGIASSNIVPELELFYDTAGRYSVSAYSSVVPVESDSNYFAGQQSSYSTNFITITDGSHMKG